MIRSVGRAMAPCVQRVALGHARSPPIRRAALSWAMAQARAGGCMASALREAPIEAAGMPVDGCARARASALRFANGLGLVAALFVIDVLDRGDGRRGAVTPMKALRRSWLDKRKSN